MCEFCSANNTEERVKARDYTLYKAEVLQSFANRLKSLAYGHIKPHSSEASALREDSKNIIRYLASEWL